MFFKEEAGIPFLHKKDTKQNKTAQSAEDLFYFSMNLLVVYRESVSLIGYITRRLSAVSKIQLVVYHQYCVLIG